MSFYLKLGAFIAVFMIIFGAIGIATGEPLRWALAGVLPGAGIGFGYLTVRERDAKIRAYKAAKAKAEAEAAASDEAQD